MADSLDHFSAYAFGGASDHDDSSFLDMFPQPAQAVLPSQKPYDVIPSATFNPQLETVHPQALLNRGGGTRSTSDERLLHARSPSSSSSAPLPPPSGAAREKHGQYTPDSQDTPKRDIQPRRLPSHSSEGQSNDKSRKRKASPSASPSRTSSTTDSTAEPTEDLDADEQHKREQFLERNRVAAHKCRQKKKESMLGLDERCRELQAKNAWLHANRNALHNELFALKNIAFEHSDCGFALIDAFIEAEASKVCARVSSTTTAGRPKQG